ncbi:hypothetical protein LTS10_007165 [Elasticomyces elasticus]|nr:hypothetical protein LTS10_007165 [Elasticomyces elasticus]
MAQPNQVQPDSALGDLGRLSGEVRNLIYELVIPQAQVCEFATRNRYLPEKPPALMLASRKIHTEMLRMYYWKTNWNINIKPSKLATGFSLIVTEAKKRTKIKRAIQIHHQFSFRDQLSTLQIREDTPLIRHITINKANLCWVGLTFELQAGSPVFHHGITCPACRPKKWASAAKDRKEAWQAAAKKKAYRSVAQRQHAMTWSERAAAYQKYRPADESVFRQPTQEDLSGLQRRYEREVIEHDASLERFTSTVLRDKRISVSGISVKDLRDVVRRFDTAMVGELHVQHNLVESLKALKWIMYGERQPE